MNSSAASSPADWSLASTVKLKGLPFKASATDVEKFFDGLPLHPEHGVMFKRHPDGRPNGEAFVVFQAAEHARSATKKDREVFGERFGERYVRVYPSLDSDIADIASSTLQSHSAVSQGQNGSQVMDSVVKVKSLPFDASQLDIIQFFEGYQLKPNGVQIVIRSNSKPTGEAFIDFANPEEAMRAVQERDHNVFNEKFGNRYVRLIHVSRKEMQATLALRFGGEGILKMKGIPFKAKAQDVARFFNGYGIKSDGISFIMHADGRPTGMAFIEFNTPQEAVRAMEKDHAKFGPEYGERFCMLQLVGRHEMDKVTLQKDSDTDPNQVLNNANMLQAAALQAQAALAANPSLLNSPLLLSNPWLLANTTRMMSPANGLNQMSNLSTSAPLIEALLAQQLQLQDSTRISLGGGQVPPFGQVPGMNAVPQTDPNLSAAALFLASQAAHAAAQAAAASTVLHVRSSTPMSVPVNGYSSLGEWNDYPMSAASSSEHLPSGWFE